SNALGDSQDNLHGSRLRATLALPRSGALPAAARPGGAGTSGWWRYGADAGVSSYARTMLDTICRRVNSSRNARRRREVGHAPARDQRVDDTLLGCIDAEHHEAARLGSDIHGALPRAQRTSSLIERCA